MAVVPDRSQVQFKLHVNRGRQGEVVVNPVHAIATGAIGSAISWLGGR